MNVQRGILTLALLAAQPELQRAGALETHNGSGEVQDAGAQIKNQLADCLKPEVFCFDSTGGMECVNVEKWWKRAGFRTKGENLLVATPDMKEFEYPLPIQEDFSAFMDMLCGDAFELLTSHEAVFPNMETPQDCEEVPFKFELCPSDKKWFVVKEPTVDFTTRLTTLNLLSTAECLSFNAQFDLSFDPAQRLTVFF